MKELEALNRIKNFGIIIPSRANGKIHTTLVKLANRQEDFEIIEKALKALEIIKEKKVDIWWLITSEDYSLYNLGIGKSHNQRLKKKEYDFLKEVLDKEVEIDGKI